MDIIAAMHPLQRYRIDHKLKQHELAALLEVTPGYISHIEKGIRGVKPNEARRFEVLLGGSVTKEQLVFWEELAR